MNPLIFRWERGQLHIFLRLSESSSMRNIKVNMNMKHGFCFYAAFFLASAPTSAQSSEKLWKLTCPFIAPNVHKASVRRLQLHSRSSTAAERGGKNHLKQCHKVLLVKKFIFVINTSIFHLKKIIGKSLCPVCRATGRSLRLIDGWCTHGQHFMILALLCFMAVLEWVTVFSIFFPHNNSNSLKCWIQRSSAFALQVLHKEQASKSPSARMPAAGQAGTVAASTSCTEMPTNAGGWMNPSGKAPHSLLLPTERVSQVRRLHQSKLAYTAREMRNTLVFNSQPWKTRPQPLRCFLPLKIVTTTASLWAGAGALKL